MIIALESDKPFEEGLRNVREMLSLERLKEMYVDKPELAYSMSRKLDTLTLEDARRWLE